MRDHGTDPKTRGALLDERIEAIKALWTNEPAEYHGNYVDFDASFCRPKPVQKLHLTDLHRRRLQRDRQAGHSPRCRLDLEPRSPPSLAQAHRPDPRRRRPRRAAGHVRHARRPGLLARLEDLGFGQVALLLPTKPRDESLRLLDEYAAGQIKSTSPRTYASCGQRKRGDVLAPLAAIGLTLAGCTRNTPAPTASPTADRGREHGTIHTFHRGSAGRPDRPKPSGRAARVLASGSSTAGRRPRRRRTGTP